MSNLWEVVEVRSVVSSEVSMVASSSYSTFHAQVFVDDIAEKAAQRRSMMSH